MNARLYVRTSEGIHLVGESSDYTLCGDALEGLDGELEITEKVESGPVTCPRCIRVIDHCRGVRIRR